MLFGVQIMDLLAPVAPYEEFPQVAEKKAYAVDMDSQFVPGKALALGDIEDICEPYQPCDKAASVVHDVLYGRADLPFQKSHILFRAKKMSLAIDIQQIQCCHVQGLGLGYYQDIEIQDLLIKVLIRAVRQEVIQKPSRSGTFEAPVVVDVIHLTSEAVAGIGIGEKIGRMAFHVVGFVHHKMPERRQDAFLRIIDAILQP